MSVIFPEAVKAQGKKSYIVVSTLADPENPTTTELTSGTALDISCYLYAGGGTSASQNTGTAPRRVCDTNLRQQLGEVTWSITDLEYVYDPQAADTDPANKAKALLAEGTEVYLVERLGLSAKSTALAADQKVNVMHVRLGVQRRGATGDDSDEFAEFNITQGAELLEDPTFDATVAAGS